MSLRSLSVLSDDDLGQICCWFVCWRELRFFSLLFRPNIELTPDLGDKYVLLFRESERGVRFVYLFSRILWSFRMPVSIFFFVFLRFVSSPNKIDKYMHT